MLGVMMKPCPKDQGKTVGPVEPNGRLISMAYWLVVEPTHLKNMRKSNWKCSPIFGVKMKNI